MPDPTRCVILVPVARHIEPECERGLQHLEGMGYPVRRVWGFSDISRGRSQIITDALADSFEEFMWIDSDIAFDPQCIDQLRRHQVPVVGGIYPAKGERRMICTPTPGTATLTFGKLGGLVEVAALGGGFILLRRSALDAIREKCGLVHCQSKSKNGILPFYQPLVVREPGQSQPSLLGEDMSFCERARQSAIKIHADTRIRLYHIGRYFFSWEDAGRDVARHENYTFRFE